MADLEGFNADEVEPQQEFSALPKGTYVVCIEESEMRDTKNGDGKYLNLRLRVLDGEFKNRVLFDRLNLFNKNEKAVQIAKASLSSICRAVGVMQPKDSSELHNKPLCAKVAVREYNGENQNEVKGYSAQASTPQPATDGKAPW